LKTPSLLFKWIFVVDVVVVVVVVAGLMYAPNEGVHSQVGRKSDWYSATHVLVGSICRVAVVLQPFKGQHSCRP